MVQFDTRLQLEIIKGKTDPVLGWYSSSFLIKEPTSVIIGKLKTTSKQQLVLNTTFYVSESK